MSFRYMDIIHPGWWASVSWYTDLYAANRCLGLYQIWDKMTYNTDSFCIGCRKSGGFHGEFADTMRHLRPENFLLVLCVDFRLLSKAACVVENERLKIYIHIYIIDDTCGWVISVKFVFLLAIHPTCDLQFNSLSRHQEWKPRLS